MEWTFYSAPNLFGSELEPDFTPTFSRSEVIGDTTHVVIVYAADFAHLKSELWDDYLRGRWEKAFDAQ